MTAFQAFLRGWSAASRSKVAILLMWFTYALIAKLVAVPALMLVLEPLAHSRMSTQLLSHFEVGWLGDLVDSAYAAAGALSGVAAVAAGLTWLVAVLFAGGAITMLDEHWEGFSFALFCSGAAEHFWRILRLSLFGLPCFALAWGLGRVPSILAKKLFGGGMEGWPLGVATIISSVLTVLLLGWVATVLDYAKLRLVSGRKRSSLKSLMISFVFVFRHFSVTMGVWGMNSLLFALAGAIYLEFSNLAQAGATATIILLVVAQQALILFRTTQRIAAWGSALEVYVALTPTPFAPLLAPSVIRDASPEVEAGVEATHAEQQGEGQGI